ncbi:MAG: hypothetical protein JW801_00520 [Bacteroidales bacterium]|nr:hypothetical protein [Bacteroidales bacterium]
MKLDRNNYEIFLIDYIDGNLSLDDRRIVERFLAANPDIAEEYENTKEAIIESDHISSLELDNLYRSFSDLPKINETNFEEFCIAYHEGDLNEEEKGRVDTYLQQNPEAKALFQLHKSIRLQADLKIQFPLKDQLKKHLIVPMRRYFYLAGASAAAILIGFGLYFASVREKSDFPPAVKRVNIANTQIENLPQSQHNSIQLQEALNRNETKAKSSPVQTRKLLAVLDTTEQDPPGTIVLARIEPLVTTVHYSMKENEPDMPQVQNSTNSQVISNYQHAHADPPPTEGHSRVINRETILVGALRVGLKGYNSLTESDLALNAEQDREGRIKGISLSGENFEMERKFNNHINKN